MFLILLRFASNRELAHEFMPGHRDWIKRGFDDGVFLLAGSIEPHSGGAVVAHNTSLLELQTRVESDPFVANQVVSAEVLEVQLSRADERLEFLLG